MQRRKTVTESVYLNGYSNEKIMEDDSMGMMIGGTNTSRAVIQIKKPDGTVAGSIRFSKPSQKKTKKLNYNFKAVSAQILLSKTSNSARKAVTKARGTVAMLLRKVSLGEYDDLDLEHAIIHARKMERIAKKREKHLKQEEQIEQKGKTEETEDLIMEELEERSAEEEELELTEEELQRLMEEYEQLMKESMEDLAEEMAEDFIDELSKEYTGAVYAMEPQELEELKQKHRSDEMRAIADADMKYLRAMFNKLEKEKQAVSSGANNFSNAPAGVSLEISGLDIPVEMPPVPEIVQGTNIDFSL